MQTPSKSSAPHLGEDAAASFGAASLSAGLDGNPPSFHLFKASPTTSKNTLLTHFLEYN